MRTIRTRSAAPIAKVSGGIIAGVVMTAVVYLLRTYAGVELTEEQVTLITTAIVGLVAYLIPIKPEEVVVS